MDILPLFPGLLLVIIVVIMYEIELRKPQNKVHFYVARNKDKALWLYLGKPIRAEESGHFVPNKHGNAISHSWSFENMGLDISDYKDLKWEDEPVEVFLNLED